MKQDNLITLISMAFPNHLFPEESSLVTKRETVKGTEEYEIAQAFRGKSWKEINSDIIRYHCSALWFFTPQAYRHFLPAYMTLCIRHYEDVDMATSIVLDTLRLPSENKTGYTRARFVEIANGFTDEQKNAIAHFLEYISENYGLDFLVYKPSTVLERYWKKFKR